MGAWLTLDAPEITSPSIGTFSPGRTTTSSPTSTRSTGTRTSRPPRSTVASAGERSISALMALRARSIEYVSRS